MKKLLILALVGVGMLSASYEVPLVGQFTITNLPGSKASIEATVGYRDVSRGDYKWEHIKIKPREEVVVNNPTVIYSDLDHINRVDFLNRSIEFYSENA